LDVPAWLLLNSCRSESLQSLKLLSQELGNGWRKRALEALTAEVVANAFTAKHITSERMRRFEGGLQATQAKQCIGPFKEKIGFVVDDCVAAPRPYLAMLRQQCEDHAAFCVSDEDRRIQQEVLEQVDRETKATDHEEMQYGFSAEVVHEQEAEQQQEQEEEQEEEQENAFTRDDEQANPWSAAVLGETPSSPHTNSSSSASAAGKDVKMSNGAEADKPFYRLADFRARPEQPLLPVGNSLWLTDNFFRPSWVGTGDRKLKSAFVVLEWHPELSKERHKRGVQQRLKLFFAEEMQKAGGDPTAAAAAAMRRAMESVKVDPVTDADMGTGMDAEAFGRYSVMLTLAEAETLRWIIRSKAHPVAKDVGFALRIVSGRLLDRSPVFVPSVALPSIATPQQQSPNDADSALCVLRLFNSEMFFPEEQLAALEKQLQDVPLHVRQAWFEECLRLRRRRTRHVWMDTPVAKLFTPQEEWRTLRARALLEGIRRALKEKARVQDVELLHLQGDWVHDALRNQLLRMRLGFSAGDLYDAVRALEADDRGLIRGETVRQALQVEEALRALKDMEGFKAAKRAQEEQERQDKANRVWQCQNCTFMNSALSSTCAVCDFGWTGQRECPPDKWCCAAGAGGCTFFNPKGLYYCSVCGRARPDLQSMSF